MSASVVALLNQKGGVGKTSTCHHLAGAFAAAGLRVLLVDNDPQASLSQGFFGPAATAGFNPAATVAALYAGDTPFPAQIVRPTGVKGIDLVPGSARATRFNVPEPETAPYEAQHCLRTFLDEVRTAYEVILIDNAPNLHLCAWAALVASNGLVVPLQAEDYGAQGLGPVQEAVETVTRGANPSLRLLGFLLTMFDKRLGIHTTYEGMLRELYGPLVFAAPFPLAKDYKEAVAARLPIGAYKPKCAAAKAAAAVAAELLDRITAAGSVLEETRGAA